ncbi:MAG: AAA family ATPase, partial [Pirellulaceae bacterium]
MKITDVKVDGFGIWSDLTIDQLGEHLTVFYGPNEAGKTTLMQFVRAVLYGYADERRQYATPVYGGVAGGKLTIRSLNGQYDIIRQGPNTGHPDDRGALDLFSSDGSLQRDHLLDTLLSNLDEPIFNNVFAIGLRELQELATLNETDAAEQLYKLSSGLDRVSLVDVLRDLEMARDAISGSKEIRSKLAQLFHERDRLRTEIEDRANAGRRWGKLSSDLTLMSQEIGNLQRRITDEQHRSKLMETALQVEERWRERIRVAVEMEQSRPPQHVAE